MEVGKASAETKKKGDGRFSEKERDAENARKKQRISSAFFYFLEEYGEQFSLENILDNDFGGAAGDAWRSMSKSKKAPYVKKAKKDKATLKKAAELEEGKLKFLKAASRYRMLHMCKQYAKGISMM